MNVTPSMPGWDTRNSPAESRPEPVDNVVDARRHPCLGTDLRQQRRGGWRLLARLDDNRVAARQGRRDLPGEQQEREIPRHDHRNDAKRLADRVVQRAVGRLAARSGTTAGPRPRRCRRTPGSWRPRGRRRAHGPAAAVCRYRLIRRRRTLRTGPRSAPQPAAASGLRCATDVRPQRPSSARRAALTARSTSPRSASSTVALGRPSTGSTFVHDDPSIGAANSPATKFRIARTSPPLRGRRTCGCRTYSGSPPIRRAYAGLLGQAPITGSCR